MRLPKTVNLRFSRLEEVVLQPNEDGGKAVIAVEVPLTPAIAEIFECRDMLFTGKGFAREFTGSIGLPPVLTGLDVRMVSNAYDLDVTPEKVRAFKVAHRSAISDGDSCPQLVLKFRVHVANQTELDTVYAFWLQTKKEHFDCTFNSHQEELFPQPEELSAEDSEPDPIAEDMAKMAEEAAEMVGDRK